MVDIFEGLNPEQTEAVLQTEGFVRIIAGAGTGKTRTLSRRFGYLVNDLGILPSNILCVTFTNKAANEMRQRIHALTGDNDTGLVSTFHGFCNTVLSEESHAVSYPKSFLVLDNGDINDILAQIYEERGLTLRHMTFSKARDMIEIQKLVEQPEYYLDMIRMDLKTLKEKYDRSESVKDIIFNGYLYHEKKLFALDYNDLITFTLYIFAENETIREKWQDRLQYIMIDEFQDIDDLQYRLMKVLCQKHRNLFVVGDPDQTIYTWRGARLRYLLEFPGDFPNTETIKLTCNYRSTPQILDAANSLIANNTQRIEKDLRAVREKGRKPLAIESRSPELEAEEIVRRITDLQDTGVSLKDMAVLYRAHYMSRNLEEALIRHKIPYVIYSGQSFYDRKEIKDALSWLRMLAFRDDLSFLRTINTPKRNIGNRRIEFLKQKADEQNISLYQALQENVEDPIFQKTLAADYLETIESLQTEGRNISEVFSEIMDRSGYEKMLRTEGSQERLDNLAELKQSIHDFEITSGEEIDLGQYLRYIATLTSQDRANLNEEIRLMTIHTAKGLEFDHVFLVGMSETMFPSKKVRTLDSMEEERRLCFVAMTRAKDTLQMYHSQGNSSQGTARYPSRFLSDILESTLDIRPDNEWLKEARIRFHGQIQTGASDQFRKGDRVLHPVFGPGTIVDTDEISMTRTIKFDRLATERTLSWRARLEREEEPRNILC